MTIQLKNESKVWNYRKRTKNEQNSSAINGTSKKIGARVQMDGFYFLKLWEHRMIGAEIISDLSGFAQYARKDENSGDANVNRS